MLNATTGREAKIKELINGKITGQKVESWIRALSKELGFFAQGVDNYVAFTNMLHFIAHHLVLNHKADTN